MIINVHNNIHNINNNILNKDINNKAQTVTFDVPQTGQKLPWPVPALAGMFAAAAAFAAFRRIRRGGLL